MISINMISKLILIGFKCLEQINYYGFYLFQVLMEDQLGMEFYGQKNKKLKAILK